MSRFGNWWRNKVAGALDRDVLGSPTNWCRWRGRDGHCRVPHRLHVMGTTYAGWAVWSVDDRGVCPRATWPEQMTCDLPGEHGPDVGGAPSPVACEDGGQRDRPITPTRLPSDAPPAGTGSIVRADGQLRIMSGIAGNWVLLDDGTRVEASEVEHPTWHPTKGLTV